MNEKEIFDKYIKVNDYIAIFSANNESIEGYVNDIDDYFLHMQIGEQCRLFRLSHIFSFVILKRYDPSEGDLDRSTIHMGRIISYKPKTLMGTISDETDGGQPRFFHLNQVDPSELDLRNILMVDGWSGTKVKFRLGLNKKGVCAQDIRMDSPSSLKYIEGEQTAIIDYYSNSGKRGYLQIEGLHETVPFHLGQVQSEELANALLRGRWRGIKVHFYFGYKSFLLCASEVREVEALSHFDEQDYLSGSIVECSPISKNTVITIRDQNGNEYKTDQRKLADLVLFDLIRERWNFADTDCQVKFRTYSYPELQ